MQVDTDGWEVLAVSDLVLSKTTKDSSVKRADDDYMRFRQHHLQINELVGKYGINLIFGEIPSGSKDVRAAFAFGGVTAMLAGLSADNTVITVTPAEAKIAITGVRHADKEDMIDAMYACFPDAPWITSGKPNGMMIKNSAGKFLTNANEHLADACAVVFAGANKLKSRIE